MLRRFHSMLWVVMLGLWLPLASHAQAIVAGTVKRVTGSAVVERDGQRLPLTVGMHVLRMDRILTGTPGAVGIALVDDTLLSAGPGTRLELSEVQFDSTSNEGRLVVRLIKGAMHMITGIVAKTSPQNVRIETPTAVMGVRGTEFIVETFEE
jgi:hypothetical protein